MLYTTLGRTNRIMLRHMTPAKQMITARGFAQPDVPTNWVLTTLIPPPAMVMA